MLLKVDNLVKSFGGLVAIDALDLQVNKGEIFSIIGPNGAGKTTLFNVISGKYRPSSGKITFEGKDITGLKPYNIARRGIARTFQVTAVFPQFTVFENIVIGHQLHAKSGMFGAVFGTGQAHKDARESREKSEKILEFTGLTDISDKPIANTTQEERKRLSIGLALATDPKLILLDEPVSGVNMQEMDGIIDLIRKIRDAGITVCLIEHKMRVVMGISDRILAINYGKKIAEGTVKEVSSNQQVIDAYLGVKDAA
jgi:branched-chain amino acid transport system ATP-binding protein